MPDSPIEPKGTDPGPTEVSTADCWRRAAAFSIDLVLDLAFYQLSYLLVLFSSPLLADTLHRYRAWWVILFFVPLVTLGSETPGNMFLGHSTIRKDLASVRFQHRLLHLLTFVATMPLFFLNAPISWLTERGQTIQDLASGTYVVIRPGSGQGRPIVGIFAGFLLLAWLAFNISLTISDQIENSSGREFGEIAAHAPGKPPPETMKTTR